MNGLFHLRIILHVYSANRECPDEYVKCEGTSPTRQCIRESWLCDGDNDCGNYWDEETELCGQFDYYILAAFFFNSLRSLWAIYENAPIDLINLRKRTLQITLLFGHAHTTHNAVKYIKVYVNIYARMLIKTHGSSAMLKQTKVGGLI